MSKFTKAQRWLIDNAYLLADRFGDNQVVVDSDSWTQILIKNFYLPSGWSPGVSRLLIYLPEIGNLFTVAPDHFYLDKGLRTYDGDKLPHYYEGSGYNDLSKEGFARFSFHIEKGWKPRLPVENGTTLVDVLNWLDCGLADAVEEAEE